MSQIIVGRVVGGTGAAGMVSMVSILISGMLSDSRMKRKSKINSNPRSRSYERSSYL
jgi:hypothetical protein